MGRQTRERRLEADDRWPSLCQFLERSFGNGVLRKFKTLTDARIAAVCSVELIEQKQMTSQWWDWNQCFGVRSSLVEFLDGCRVDLDFASDVEARGFMNGIYDELIVAIRRHERGWKP
jgi:hypothetical protein